RTEYHGQLKAKFAKLRTQLLEPPKVKVSDSSFLFFVTLSHIPNMVLVEVKLGLKLQHMVMDVFHLLAFQGPSLISLLTIMESSLWFLFVAVIWHCWKVHTVGDVIHKEKEEGAMFKSISFLAFIIPNALYHFLLEPKVIAVAKSSNLVLMVLDASKILTKELEAVGSSLNKRPP
ncbi:hypothetical protein HID58_055530, partial [Brassica napus]